MSTILLKFKDFSRSQAVKYTVKVVIDRKRCKIEMSSLHKSLIEGDIIWPVNSDDVA